MNIKLALPTGDPRPHVGQLLERAGIVSTGYEPSSRVLRSVVEDEGYTLRVFRERDIPIQVAMGNYDLGICGDVWLTEVQSRFPLQHLVRIGTLPGPRTQVWVCAAPESGITERQMPPGAALAGARIGAELPNLADHFAIHHRIPGYRLIPLYGSGDAYPPEDAELVLMLVASAADVRARGLVPVSLLFDGGLALVANADSLATKPLGSLISRLCPLLGGDGPTHDQPTATPGATVTRQERSLDVVRLAVPDGHAQRHTPAALAAAGLVFDGYSEKSYVRRPVSGVPGLEVKVVRPQDMPQLVAMGMFDIAISGRDLLFEHLSKFPNSPVTMAVDLATNRYRIGPVVDADFPADTTSEAVAIWNSLGRPVRIASEFPATAERFALDHHLTFTTIIPVAGASEGFVPEDADFLVEGTETGTSIRANGLKMLDTYMESTACVVTRSGPVTRQTALLESLVQRLAASVAEVAVT
jgi:ATP phosphoribosyltransferase